MEITVKLKTVYGEERIYPACHTADLLCEWLAQKTFTKRDIAYLKKLGYNIRVTTETHIF